MKKSETLQGLMERMSSFCRSKRTFIRHRTLHVSLSRKQALVIVEALEALQKQAREEHIMETLVLPVLRADNPSDDEVQVAEDAMMREGMLISPSGLPTGLNSRWAWFKENRR